jgi:hypothetical protein
MLARMLLALRVGGPTILALAIVAAPAMSAPTRAGGALDEKEIEATLDQLKEGIADEDYKAISEALQRLDLQYPELTPKDLKKVVKLVKAVFAKVRPPKELPGSVVRIGPVDPFEEIAVEDEARGEVLAMYRLAIGLMFDRPEGEEVLVPTLKLEHIREWPEVQMVVLQGLGFRSDPGLTRLFADYLEHEDPYIAGTAAESLGQLAGKPLEERRPAVEAIIEAFNDAEKAAKKEERKVKEDDPTPLNDRLQILWVSFNEGLKALTGEGHDGPAAWREWFAEHGKGEDW